MSSLLLLGIEGGGDARLSTDLAGLFPSCRQEHAVKNIDHFAQHIFRKMNSTVGWITFYININILIEYFVFLIL